MTLRDAQRLFAHWRRYPPLRDLVAGFVGFKPKDAAAEAESKYMNAADMRRLMSATGGKLSGVTPR